MTALTGNRNLRLVDAHYRAANFLQQHLVNNLQYYWLIGRGTGRLVYLEGQQRNMRSSRATAPADLEPSNYWVRLRARAMAMLGVGLGLCPRARYKLIKRCCASFYARWRCNQVHSTIPRRTTPHHTARRTSLISCPVHLPYEHEALLQLLEAAVVGARRQIFGARSLQLHILPNTRGTWYPEQGTRNMGQGTRDVGHGTWDRRDETRDRIHESCNIGIWEMEHGPWDMEYGTWNMGHWNIVTWDGGHGT